ncbi:fimbrial protein [Vibrio sp. VB16]|uniref:fimbrial protein n=1 Tax=Vibrio sp. VB16 TaxID=2785746 RepID=UPI00189CADA8|nr:fimbrial protein [Vibrio sp. VB16]UGA53582.1 type 1 fimbrial protein [Vibrio sp. VB16]
MQMKIRLSHLKWILSLGAMAVHCNTYATTTSCVPVPSSMTMAPISLADISVKDINSAIDGRAWGWMGKRTFSMGVKLCIYQNKKMTVFSNRVKGTPKRVSRINLNNVYPTNNENIGYMIRSQGPLSEGRWEIFENNPKLYERYMNYDPNNKFHTGPVADFTVMIEFVALKSLSPGTYTITQQTVGKIFTVDGYKVGDPHRGQMRILSPGFTFNVISSTCDIEANSKVQTVKLPMVTSNNFKGPGTTTGETRFTMDLDCPQNISISASMIDSNSLNNTNDFLSLDTSSTAAGVGIQILANNSDKPVQYGADQKWYITGTSSSPETKYSIPFIARYVQTKAKVTPGSLSAQSVISFYYE